MLLAWNPPMAASAKVPISADDKSDMRIDQPPVENPGARPAE